MGYRISLAIILAAVVSACGTSPKSADEFRAMAPNSSFIKLEQFEVDRPFHQVAQTLRQRSEACLNIRVTSRTSGGYRSHGTTFRKDYLPTTRVNGDRAELQIQAHIEGTNLIKVHEEPKGGYFLLIADAFPAGRNKTRIDLYRPTIGHDVLVKAVRNWTTGDNLGCPDLTK